MSRKLFKFPKYSVNCFIFQGTPWQPEFGGWAFNLKRGEECVKKWNLIPEDTDVLITHGPPLGFGDLCSTGIRAGCVDLLQSVQNRVKPKYHVYGHIHEGSNELVSMSSVWGMGIAFVIGNICAIFKI